MDFDTFTKKWIPEHSQVDLRTLHGVVLYVDKEGKLKDLVWIDPTSIGKDLYLYRWVFHSTDTDPLPDVKDIHPCKVGKLDISVRNSSSEESIMGPSL